MNVVLQTNAKNIVDFIGSIFEKRGDEEYLGEPVTMGQHMLQGATMAEQSREPDEIIIGTLLHDIGHFTSEFGTFRWRIQKTVTMKMQEQQCLSNFSQRSLLIVADITLQLNAICVLRIQNISKAFNSLYSLLIFKADRCARQK